MENKILLVIESPKDKKKYINCMPPLGILYLTSYLESKNIPIEICDCNVSKLDIDKFKDYEYIGFSINCSNITKTLETAEKFKNLNKNIKIIVGGPQATGEPEFFIGKEFIDAVVLSEGEEVLYEILTKGINKEIKGIYFKTDNKVIFTGERDYIHDLDKLPFPALDRIDLKKYNIPIKKKKIVSTIITSRGCPYTCIFCFHPHGHKWRARSAENIMEEIEWQIKKFGVQEICFLDDNVTLDPVRLEKLFDMLIEKKLGIIFQLYGGMRADKINKELLVKMKKAGGWLANISPETGDPETLIKIKKGFKLEDSKKVIKWSKELGLFTYSNFMVGFPWETKESIEKTINFAKELNTDMVQFSRVLPFPNTELYAMIGKKHSLNEDTGLFYEDAKNQGYNLSPKEINELIKKAYRKCYFRPRKIFRIMINLRPKDIFLLSKYAFVTKSV
ncbi:MAG: radical SAM protein [Nanoarchaeota archaeon]